LTVDAGSVISEPDAALPPAAPATRLTILYDERCAFCLRCRDWLATQPCLIEVDLLPSGSHEAKQRFGAVPWLGRELVVVDDQGHVWVGPAAFLMCLWATARHRHHAYLFARPRWAPHAERFFMYISRRRDRLGAWLGKDRPDDCSWCDDVRIRYGP
jgi:predicted DCC family thiol-disulfide oxidoreductase YuxK